jgi:hypothetical protein
MTWFKQHFIGKCFFLYYADIADKIPDEVWDNLFEQSIVAIGEQ